MAPFVNLKGRKNGIKFSECGVLPSGSPTSVYKESKKEKDGCKNRCVTCLVCVREREWGSGRDGGTR